MQINNHIVSPRERRIIINEFLSGKPIDQIAASHQLTPPTIKKYIKEWEETDDILSPDELCKSVAKNGVVPRRRPLQGDPLYDGFKMMVFGYNV